MARLNQGLIFTNDNCIGCNRCISGCPVLGANISSTHNGINHIMVDGSKCIHCGHCISMCKHGAREYLDDTENFLQDLRAGEKISLAVAPSFYMEMNEQAEQILGYLKSLGVSHIYNVSYGADIATYAYIMYQENHPISGAVSTSCPAIVNYIEKQKPSLLSKLMPVKSPLMCLATYVHKYLQDDSKLAFISPCIAKKDEMEREALTEDGACVSYNVTYDHLKKALQGVDLSKYTAQVDLEDFGFGNIFPISSGLKKNIEHFIGDETTILERNGVSQVYPCINGYLAETKEDSVFLYDFLNCSNGCTNGPGTETQKEDYSCALQNEIHLKEYLKKSAKKDTPFEREVSCGERLARIKKCFEHLELTDFLTEFHDRSEHEPPVSEYRLDTIYRSMHKTNPQDRLINCQSCGYKSCHEMAVAIAKGYNVISNCVHYAKDENMRLLVTERLTGLPSMFSFEKFMEKVIQSGHADEYTIIFFNIKNFTLVNEQFGTMGGDDALKQYAASAVKQIRSDEILARVGGNNFLAAVKKQEYVTRVRALNSIVLYMNPEDNSEAYPIFIRGGIYFMTGNESTSVAVNRAAIAYAIAHRSENVDFAYFDEQTKLKLFDEMMLGRSLPKALDNNEFVVYYQPKVSIEGKQLMGAEALVRWKTSEGMVSPGKFIPLCEKNGFVKKIDFFVLNCVCKDLRKWIDSGMTPVRISSNFSKQHFQEPGISSKILEVVDSWQIPHELIEVEFTETAYVEEQNNLEKAIIELKQYGFYSSMDDFGSGYSSLNLLQNLSFDVLKLDKSLLGDNINSRKTQRVIANVIRMAKELSMEIIAEGVETREEYDFLQELECDLIQGYIFDRPLPESEFVKRLQTREYTLN